MNYKKLSVRSAIRPIAICRSREREADGFLLLREADPKHKGAFPRFPARQSAPFECYAILKKAVLLILFLTGIIHPESFGQSGQHTAPLRFKAGNTILYKHYADNYSELNRLRGLIEQHKEDISSNRGYFQLIALIPKAKSGDPAVLNRAAHCASVVRAWIRVQDTLLAKTTCAFSFSASSPLNAGITVHYIASPLDTNTPQAVHFTYEEEDAEAVQRALSKYQTLPFAPAAASTGNTPASIRDFIIYFRADKSNIDPAYMNNAAVLERMDRIVTKRNVAHINSLIISAYASPEASSAYNKRLSEKRANAVRDYFLKRFPLLRPDIVHARGHGENWDGLRHLAEKDPQLPMQEEVLRIINSNLSEDAREGKLKALQRGAVYRYIYNNLYPRLRLGASLNVMLAQTAPEDLQTLILGSAIQPAAIGIEALQATLPPVTLSPLKPAELIKKEKYSYPVAFRTNLLYDAAGALNIGVEIPIGKKKNWSLIADMAYAYWRSPKNLYALQTLEYGVESRYWFGVNQKRKERNPNWAQPLKGLYAGVYARYWQRYDVQFVDGYQGDALWSAGLTAGYAIPLNRSLSFDFGIGAGWASTSQYRHYHEPEYNENGNHHLMWQQTGKWSGLLPAKLRFALVWMIRTANTQKREGSK